MSWPPSAFRVPKYSSPTPFASCFSGVSCSSFCRCVGRLLVAQLNSGRWSALCHRKRWQAPKLRFVNAIRVYFGQSRTAFGRSRPLILSNWAQSLWFPSQTWSNGQLRVNFGRMRPQYLGQSEAKVALLRSNSGTTRPLLTASGLAFTKPVVMLAGLSPNVAIISLNFAKLGAASVPRAARASCTHSLRPRGSRESPARSACTPLVQFERHARSRAVSAKAMRTARTIYGCCQPRSTMGVPSKCDPDTAERRCRHTHTQRTNLRISRVSSGAGGAAKCASGDSIFPEAWFGSIWTDLDHLRADVGPAFDRARPTLAARGLAKSGRAWPNFVGFDPILADFDQVWPRLAKFGRFRPNLWRRASKFRLRSMSRG